MSEKILDIKNLSVAYGEKIILRDVNFSVNRGEIFVIVGESGSGKSTILKAIDGILENGGKIIGGQIFFNGQDITNISVAERKKISGESIGMIFQNSGAAFCPVRTIGEQIFESVRTHKNFSRTEFFERAKNIMKNIRLDENILSEYPFKLSGGMAQRAGILSAMILEPKILLADEPTSALDAVTQFDVVEELLKLKISIVLVTHNIGVAFKMADKILVLKNGEVVELGTREEIFKSPKNIYTKELINSVARLNL